MQMMSTSRIAIRIGAHLDILVSEAIPLCYAQLGGMHPLLTSLPEMEVVLAVEWVVPLTFLVGHIITVGPLTIITV